MQPSLSLDQRVEVLAQLGELIGSKSVSELEIILRQAEIENPWFTIQNTLATLTIICDQYLNREALDYLVKKYHLDDNIRSQRIALIPAGNIPLVGWHDLMCCFLAGHISVIRLSEKDTVLMQYMMDTMVQINAAVKPYFEIIDRLQNYQAAIATGSNTSAQQFKKYFSEVPNIIRANRNSIAVITGRETKEQLENIGNDIFSYFGLGCRNVSKIFIPHDYDLACFIESLQSFEHIIHHNKYKNNFDYNLALMLLNREEFLQGPFFLLKESEAMVSRIASLHYQRYQNIEEVENWLSAHENEIQCVVSSEELSTIKTILPGTAQSPTIDTWADGIDTMQFLLALSH